MKVNLFDSGETIYIRDGDVTAVAESASDPDSVGIFTSDGRVFRVAAKDFGSYDVAKHLDIDTSEVRG